MPASHIATEHVNDPATKRALELAAARADGEVDEGALRGLSSMGRESLQRARDELVARLYRRPDDYEATAALTLVNGALATLGWENPFDWRRRRKP